MATKKSSKKTSSTKKSKKKTGIDVTKLQIIKLEDALQLLDEDGQPLTAGTVAGNTILVVTADGGNYLVGGIFNGEKRAKPCLFEEFQEAMKFYHRYRRFIGTEKVPLIALRYDPNNVEGLTLYLMRNF